MTSTGRRQEDEKYLKFAIELAQRSGELALSRQHNAHGSHKPDHTLVTDADILVQSFIREQISKRFPEHAFLGEEDDGSPHPNVRGTEEGLWIVDPIDGTQSYLLRIPIWAVCLGLAIRGEARLGVVAIPSTGVLFHAVAGGRAYRNNEPLRVCSGATVGSQSILLVSSEIHKYVNVRFPGKVRAYGSTGAHICYVASGTVQGAVFSGAGPWDIFAAGIILEAAGGGMFEPDGTRLELDELARAPTLSPPLVASTEALARPILATLKINPQQNHATDPA